MKNSPEEEWLHSLEKRLREFTEEPDADLWNRITAKVNHERRPVWIPWANRAAALIALIALLLSWPVSHKEDPRSSRKSSNEKEHSSEQRSGKNGVDISDAEPSEQAESQPLKTEYAADGGLNNSRANTDIKDVISMNVDDSKDAEKSEMVLPDLSTSVKGTPPQTDNEEIIQIDTITPLIPKHDSVKFHVKETEKKNRAKRKNKLVIYASVTPSLAYQKVTPEKNDGIVINRFNARSVLSADRFGLNLEAGVQGRLSEKLEFYSGLSIYSQNQTLTYQYQSGDEVNVTQQTDFNYTVTPGKSEQSVNYDMLTIGGQAGLLYQISGDRLKHKLGAGLSYQHGILKPEEGTYKNDRSQYLFYQIFYRNEYSLNNSVRIFLQPFYTHAFFSKEKMNEPFRLTPYRAGIGFGLIYQFNQNR